MGRILKYLIYLSIAGVAFLLGYSYFGNISPAQEEVRFEIEVPSE